MLIRPAISSMLQCFARVLFFVFLGSLCLHMNAQSSGKIIPKVTIASRSITISEVFKLIRKQTGKVIWYRNEDINENKKVTVNFKDASLEDVLRYLFQASDISWTYDDEAIILRKKKLSENINTSTTLTDTSLSTIQLITVTGKVTDEKGSPIIGATVVLKGNNLKGTTTNSEGTFILDGVKANASLVITSVSFLTQEIPVRGRQSLGSVVMKEYVGVLDETVIIAYGTMSRRLNTGNIGSVKVEEIEKQPINNPLLALQGRVPGVQITQGTGLSGSGIKVLIQGQNSILNGNDPFYVIDGVPYTSQLLPNLGNILGTTSAPDARSGTNISNGNPLSFINPADIESIEILKDADATSIYGSRAANGAILITTKKGKPGQTKFDINLQTGIGKVTRKINMLNLNQYLEMRREAKFNTNLPIGRNDYDINGLWDTTRYTNWQKELIGGTAKYTDIQTSLSGGNASTQFLLGAGYHKETTVYPGNFSDIKGSLHFNINHNSSDQRFTVQLTGNYLTDNNHLPTIDLTNSIFLAPNAPNLYNIDGSLNWAPNANGISSWNNPLATMQNKYSNKTNNLLSNILISYKLLNGIEFKTSFGYTNMQSNEIAKISLLSKKPENRPNLQRSAEYSDNNITSWIIEPQINYTRNILGGKLNTLIGMTLQNSNSSGQIVKGIGYNSDLLMSDIRSANTITISSTINSVYKYNAGFLRINYNYHDKYLLNLTSRRDGSSRFGSKNKFHNFGSVGLAWLFSNESFFKKNPIFSYGKFRASYGTTGSDQIGDYQFLNLYQSYTVGIPYQGVTGILPAGLPNPYLQWEEVRKLQLGLDLGLFKDRVVINSSYFQNRSSNQLLSYALPAVTGSVVVTSNFPAVVQNTGWELSLSSINIRSSKLSWRTNVNLTIPRNKLVDFSNINSSSYANLYMVGQPITLRKAFKFMGVNPETGTYQFLDSKGNLTSDPNSLNDQLIFQNTSPTFYGGFHNSLEYKSFQFDILFQFVKQNGDNNSFGNAIPGVLNTNQPATVLSRWKAKGDATNIQMYNSNYGLITSYFQAVGSDAAYTDASYIKLKNISISWLFPVTWLNRIHVTKAKVYLQGQNLFTITNYKGLDPETRSSSILPPLRVLVAGIQVTL